MSSDGSSERDELTAEERAALGAWEVGPPAADLSGLVLSRVEVAVRRRRRLGAAAAAAVVLAMGGALAIWSAGPADRVGAFTAAGRTTRDLGRAVVVAEAGAALRWNITSRGARVEQPRGDVFYRVNRGGPFVVKTPGGSVRVLGTCFRLEVKEMGKSRAGVLGAAAGAAAATLIVVTVYEGKVLIASPRGETAEVGAGHAARIEGQGPPRLDTPARQETAATLTGPAAGRIASPARLARTNQELLATRKRLEQEVTQLEEQLKQATGEASKRGTKVYGLSRQELLGMARRCELRWDMPSLARPGRVDSKAVRELGLSATEQAAIKKSLGDHHRQMKRDLRRLYIKVTGDEQGVDSLSLKAMVSEIKDKSASGEVKRVFQRLARERAGLAKAPVSHTGTSALEQLYRLITTSGDRVEKSIAAEIGPDLARRYRDVRNGFGSRSRSSHGCP